MTLPSVPDIVTVMDDKECIYRRCRNCNKYFSIEEGSKQIFCSADCSTVYASCIVCGRYFRKTTGVSDNTCSEQCSSVLEKAVSYQKTL